MEPKADGRYALSLGGAVGGVLPVLFSSQVGVGAQAALRGGVIVQRVQFQLDVSPASTVLSVSGRTFATFETTGSVGYLARLSDRASWVFRVGGGGAAAFTGGALGSVRFGEVRADVFGVAVRTSDHLLVELNAPSYRVLIPVNGSGVSMMWVTSVGIDYLL